MLKIRGSVGQLHLYSIPSFNLSFYKLTCNGKVTFKVSINLNFQGISSVRSKEKINQSLFMKFMVKKKYLQNV